MKTIQKIAALICGTVLAFSSATAEDSSGFYVSPEISRATLKDYCIAGLDSCEDSEIGFGLTGGYRFNKFLAVETGIRYASGFDFKASGPAQSGSGFATGTGVEISGDSKFTSFALGARGYLPIGERFFVTAKAGFHRVSAKLSSLSVGEDSSGGSIARTDNIDESATKPYFGVGGGFSFTDNISGLVEYSRFKFNDGDADIISASAVLHF